MYALQQKIKNCSSSNKIGLVTFNMFSTSIFLVIPASCNKQFFLFAHNIILILWSMVWLVWLIFSYYDQCSIERVKPIISYQKNKIILLLMRIKCYTITEHSTCFWAIPVESGCNVVWVRDSQHALVRLFQIHWSMHTVCKAAINIMFWCFLVGLMHSMDNSGISAGYKHWHSAVLSFSFSGDSFQCIS